MTNETMEAKDIKNVHVITKTWRDKVNGNTYFAQLIFINWGLKGEQMFFNPFQYGYSFFNHYALRKVAEVVGCEFEELKHIKLFGVLVRGCKKRDLKSTDCTEWMGW